jgi:nucleotide-binding universal stress UspA family protein
MEHAPVPFTDILVPLDGSPLAERALGPALDLSTRTGVPVRVLRRVFPDETEDGAAYLADLADRYAGTIDLETQIDDRASIPDAILDGLAPGSLLCMTSHGRGGIARAVMGSIAEAVLRTIDRPALVVGPDVDDRTPLAGRVVACVDGSPASERTLEPARRWARALELPLWLVGVGDTGAPAEWVTGGDAMETGHLANLARRLGDVEGWEVLHDAHPAGALIDMAGATRPWPTALLVLATHGRTGWDRLRLGSVTTATVHGSPRPVLVVPVALAPEAREGEPEWNRSRS